MEFKNKFDDISDEDLLDALDNKQQVKSIDGSITDLFEFIKVFNLKDGKIKVKPSVIYKIYSRWSKKPLTAFTFGLRFGLIFEKVSGRYQLNQSALDMAKIILKEPVKMRDKTKSPKMKKHFEFFLNKFDIVPGDFFIKVEVLYDLYDKWSYENNRKVNLLYSHVFSAFCKMYFKSKTDLQTIYFAVDRSILNKLTQEQKLLCLSAKGKTNALKKEKVQEK